MKTITIRQPWAWAIMAGHKLIENRTWRTSHRGPLFIHAGAQVDADPRCAALFAALGILPPVNLVRGCILGSVKMVDVVPLEGVSSDPWAFGPWCWILESPVLFPEPVPWKGQLSLFDIPLEALAPKVQSDLLF